MSVHERWSCGRGRAVGLLAVVALAVALAAAPFAAHAEGALEVLQVGWDGTVVPGTWSPVRVLLRQAQVLRQAQDERSGAEAAARVEVVLSSRFQQGPMPSAAAIEFPVGAYGQEVALPAGVAKEVTIWVPADSDMVGLVRLSAGGQTLAEQRVEFRSARTPFWPLVGVLAEAPTVARWVSQVELPYQGMPIPLSVARLAAADLPPSAERLAALSALVVQGNAGATLTGEQRRAVQEWVAAGGHLVLAGGPDAPRVAAVLPPGALPVTFDAAESAADLAALARWAEAREGTLAPGPAARFHASAGAVLAGTAEQPLAWRLGLGLGTVTLLAADPGLQPLAGWSGAPALLQKALEPALPSPAEDEKMRYLRMDQSRNAALRLQGAVEALPPEVFPGWQTVALVLGGFALVVGPLMHVLLWRLDRRGWVWLAVPAAAVLLSGALYYVGVGRDGRDVLANVVSYIRLDPEAGQAQQALVAGFFAPTHPQLDVTVPGEAPIRAMSLAMGPFGPGGLPGSISTDPPFHVLGGRETRVEFTSGQWVMRSVILQRTVSQDVGAIAANLGIEGGLIKGTVRNDTPFLLEDAAVVVGQSLAKVGALAPGQSAPVVLEPESAAVPFRGSPPLSYRLFGRRTEEGGSGGGVSVMVAYSGPAPPVPAVAPGYRGPMGMPEQLELPRDPEVLRRARLMDQALSGPQHYGPNGMAMPLTFLAFTRAPGAGDLPRAGNHPIYYLALLEQPLRLALAPGPFSMPVGLMPAEMLAQTTGVGGGGNGVLQWLELGSGSVTYGFRPPLPARAQAEALLVTTRQAGPSVPMAQTQMRGAPPPPPSLNLAFGPAEADVFSVYNWQSATWDPLPGGQEQARLAPAAPYLGPDGLVKVQVNAGLDRLVRFGPVELAVEGQVVG